MSVFKKLSFRETRDRLLSVIGTIGTENVELSELCGRVIAGNITAAMMIPHYDRSPFDGYALRSEDVAGASEDNPVTLKIIYEIKAGDTAGRPVKNGEAVKILTGAPVPDGADCVQKYEDTVFDEDSVTLSAPLKFNQNVVRAGEDVKSGMLLAENGTVADAAVMGMLASQGIGVVPVFRRPRVAVISTGSELVEVGEQLTGSRIYNTNRYMLEAELRRCGCIPFYAGLAGDDPGVIAKLVSESLDTHDAVVITGGVSAGDYDFVPEAMEMTGVEILCQGVKMKPGMASVYGFRDGKPCFGLSGNPASAMTSFYAVCRPILRKYAGERNWLPEMIKVNMTGDFGKSAGCERLLRGRMSIENGVICMRPSSEQGNAVISSMAGANLMVIIPAGHGPVHAGEIFDGFMI